MSLSRRLMGRVASAVPGNLAMRLDRQPLCTFTFDDCPRSSLYVAGSMLESRNASGTYFVAASMLEEDGELMLRPSDLSALAERGHELGCHTFSHAAVDLLTKAELVDECSKNARELSASSRLARDPVSFSYPFGAVSISAKLEIGKRFSVARGVREGLNYRLLDMAEVRACSIFHHNYSTSRMRQLIERCRRQSAWLVFYTHDVAERPSHWGCTPGEFEEVLDLVKEAGIEILPMRGAVGRFMFRRPVESA